MKKHRALILAVVLLVATTLLSGLAAAYATEHYVYQYWAPSTGYFQVSGSYAYNDLWWDATRQGYYFSDQYNRNGYDHENWFYDYRRPYGGPDGAYASGAYSWSSNLPGPQDMDNNFANPSGEVGVEVDVFAGHLIAVNTWYYLDFNLVRTSSSWSRAKVRGVRTLMDPNCYTWVCAGEWDGTILVPFDNYIAPGDRLLWTN